MSRSIVAKSVMVKNENENENQLKCPALISSQIVLMYCRDNAHTLRPLNRKDTFQSMVCMYNRGMVGRLGGSATHLFKVVRFIIAHANNSIHQT